MIRIKGIRIDGVGSSIRVLSKGKFPWWMGALFVIVGCVALVFSIHEHRNSEELKAHGVQVEAMVTDVRRHESHRNSRHGHSSRSVTYYPTVTYTDKAGVAHTVESSAGVSSRTTYSKGDTVRVLYMPTDPQRMEIVGMTSPFSHYIFMGAGGLFLVVGVGLTLYGLKHKKLNTPESEEEVDEDMEKPQPPYPL